MAAVESSASLEDDEDWLYGDEKKPNVDQLNEKIAKKKKTDVKKETESGDDSESQNKSVDNAVNGAGDAEDDEDDDDDDDDDVQVTIGDIRTWTGTETAPRNLFKSGQNYQKGSTISPAKPMPATKGLDIDAVGTINGTPVYDFDLNSLSTDEMPWRKPGADINDYFNYGFTEETWRIYSERQKILRSEGSGGGGGSNVGSGGSGSVMFPTPIAKLFKAALPRPMLPKPGLLPPPVSLSNAISILNSIANSANNIANNNMPLNNNAPSNNNNNIITIGVIGGNSSRRKDDSLEQPIPVAGSFNRAIPVTYNQPPPSMPNTNLPPPVMQVHPQFGTGMPHFDSFYPPAMPQQAPQFIGGNFPPAFPPPFADPNPPPVNTQPHWEPRRGRPFRFHGRDRWEIGRPEHARSPPRRDDDYDSRIFRERDRDRERDWDREKDREWERGREKSRDRDRSKEQERSRDVDRSRERDRERSRERDRERSRERDRERSRDRNKSKDRDRDHDRDRDRNRDRERERSKSKERETARNKDQERGRETTRARDRDDKHKASRRKHREREHEESDTESRSSSKHKKSKRRKESKDEETPAPATTEEKPRE